MAATAKAASPAAAPREAAFVSESWEEVERSLRGLASSEAQLVVFASAWHPTGCAFGVAVATARSEHRFVLPVSVVLADDETKGAGAFLCSQGVFGPPAIALFSGGASHAAAMPVVLRTESLGDLTAVGGAPSVDALCDLCREANRLAASDGNEAASAGEPLRVPAHGLTN
ncbi:hypothetical protein FNF27_06546 [Cafeteria roenbergensis]|uniref:Thioredoxin domain-containing protein n=1 Tax=Cafeteria roenbergensis TaxID=33653 RepID=A0A5A8DZU8_CAFRO|nr:hypothetical protein FNF27_06546 [Cafeteria roenbergensis]